MFETIGTLFTIAMWAAAVFFFLSGIVVCICNFASGKGWEIFRGVVAVVLGIVVFWRMYTWLQSIVWCLLVTGIVLCIVTIDASEDTRKNVSKEKSYGIGQAFLDAYVEEKVIEEAVTNAIRKSKE